jgi:hypothetical protein
MSGIYKEQKEIICPYYKSESSREIVCEGIVGTRNLSTFHDKAAKEEHIYDFCNGNYQGCPLCIELDAKYT